MGNTADKQSASVDTFASAVTDFADAAANGVRVEINLEDRTVSAGVASDEQAIRRRRVRDKARRGRHSAGVLAGNRVLNDGALVNARHADMEPQTWTGRESKVQMSGGRGMDARPTLTLNNHDNAIGTLCLADGVGNRNIRLWTSTGNAPG